MSKTTNLKKRINNLVGLMGVNLKKYFFLVVCFFLMTFVLFFFTWRPLFPTKNWLFYDILQSISATLAFLLAYKNKSLVGGDNLPENILFLFPVFSILCLLFEILTYTMIPFLITTLLCNTLIRFDKQQNKPLMNKESTI